MVLVLKGKIFGCRIEFIEHLPAMHKPGTPLSDDLAARAMYEETHDPI